MSGYDLADGVDLLIHDAQYDTSEYDSKIGWGHSTIEQTFAFAKTTSVGHLVPFHHDPSHDDDELERLYNTAITEDEPFTFTIAAEGDTFTV
jgi:ribonuclease BN (tRNA processing enzyme)